MDQIIVAWTKTGDAILERHVPLRCNGQRNRRLGSANRFHVVFLEGLRRLSPSYREELEALGYTLHDAESSYRRHEAHYRKMERFGDYDRKCFLRWLVIRDVFGDVPFIHYDGDVVFNATPEELESAYAGITFVLQGCPAFSYVSDRSWLPQYLKEFNLFFQDMEAYSTKAWRQRRDFLPTFRKRNTNLWERELISSDQDLFRFLAMSDGLPQADAATLHARSNLVLFQNPICIADDIHLPLPLTYRRTDSVDYLGGRKVAIWHMQADFSDYLGFAAYRRQLGSRSRFPRIRNRRALHYLPYRAIRTWFSPYNRLWLLKRFFDRSDDLAFLLNGQRFWQEGVFV